MLNLGTLCSRNSLSTKVSKTLSFLLALLVPGHVPFLSFQILAPLLDT